MGSAASRVKVVAPLRGYRLRERASPWQQSRGDVIAVTLFKPQGKSLQGFLILQRSSKPIIPIMPSPEGAYRGEFKDPLDCPLQSIR
ncbi:MAG: hypothetical protein U0905_00935 [Pirellulales bacterium]